MVLRSNFALLLTTQFALLISSLINIISLLLTTLEFFIFGGSLLGRIQGDREPVSLLLLLLLAIPVGDAIWFCPCSFFFFFFLFFPPLLSRPYLWNRYSQRLQIECAAWSCCLILHYSLPSNSLRYFFFFPPQFCRRHTSGTVTRRDSRLSVLLGPAV